MTNQPVKINPNQNTPIWNLIHPLIAAVAVTIGYFIGLHFAHPLIGVLIAANVLSGYFIGWEVCQAVYRAMAATGETWSTLKLSAVVAASNWDFHTLVWNLAVPFAVLWSPVFYLAK